MGALLQIACSAMGIGRLFNTKYPADSESSQSVMEVVENEVTVLVQPPDVNSPDIWLDDMETRDNDRIIASSDERLQVTVENNGYQTDGFGTLDDSLLPVTVEASVMENPRLMGVLGKNTHKSVKPIDFNPLPYVLSVHQKPQENHNHSLDDLPVPSAIFETFSKIETVERKWCWPGVLPAETITVIYGQAGIGKSFLATMIASVVSVGGMWPDGESSCFGEVLFLGSEDDPASTIQPRLINHGADLERVHHCKEYIAPGDMVGFLRKVIQYKPAINVVIIERLLDDLAVDAKKASVVMAELQAFAHNYGITMIVLAHTRKNQGSVAMHNLLGTSALSNGVRIMWSLEKDADLPDRILFKNVKNNLTTASPTRAFRIVNGTIEWEPDPIPDASLFQPPANSDRVEEDQDIFAFLKAELADGPKPSVEIFLAGKEQGYSKSQLGRAAIKLKVRKYKSNEFQGAWYWELKGSASSEGEE